MSNWYIWWLLFIIVFIYLPVKRARILSAKRIIDKKSRLHGRDIAQMKELAKQFVGKDVYVRLLKGHADGILKETTDNGLLIESKDGVLAVNFDYVVSMLEYPHKNNGKRKAIFDLDS